jgi:hypothetical protein
MDAAALTTFLAPFLPALLNAGQAVLDTAAGRAGAEALEHGRRLWQRLRPKVEESPAAEQAAARVAASPDDRRWRTALELQLEELLAQDPVLANEIAELWESAHASGVVAAGARSVAVRGNVSGTIVTGDNASIGG